MAKQQAPAAKQKQGFPTKIQWALLLVGVAIALDHVMLSLDLLSNDGRDLSSKCWLSNQNIDAVDVGLATISNEISCSSRLTTAEKEKLEATVRKLQEQETQKEKEEAAFEAALMAEPAPFKSKSPYAYMFLVGNVHEDRHEYRGFLYDVLVSTYLLQQLGSTADTVVFVQMAADSKMTELSKEEQRSLRALNIQVHTLPKQAPSTDGELMLTFEKLRGLQLTQYKRVTFLIADAMPLANLDYLFHLSDPEHTSTPTILQPNVILASRGEPCTSALFMLQPEEGAWEKVAQMIQKQLENKDRKNFARGWGYDFAAENDQWRATVKSGTQWRFHGGFADQGLLYYWTKYYKRQVSIVIQDEIENWIDSPDAPKTRDGQPKPILQNTLNMEPLQKYSRSHPLAYQFECDTPKIQEKDKKHQPQQCVVPYRDYVHMFGDHKPWAAYSPERKMARKNSKEFNAATSLWFTMLKELNAILSLNLDFDRSLLEQTLKRAQ